MSLINDFLLWLEEHQIGILTTIAIHLFIIAIFMILKIRTNSETGREYNIMIDMAIVDDNLRELTPEEIIQQQSNIQDYQQEYNQIRNIPINRADERAMANVEKMVRDVKAELNIVDRPQDKTSEKIPQEERVPENVFDDKFPVNAAGERIVYKGLTTVSYELSGRRHTWMPAPVYKCREGGTIVVNIIVNGNGYVLTADIDRIKSNSDASCLVEAAKRDAVRSRFDESALTRQQGSITYIFQAQ